MEGREFPPVAGSPVLTDAWPCQTLHFAAWSLFIVSMISELHFVLETIFSQDAAVLVCLWLMLLCQI